MSFRILRIAAQAAVLSVGVVACSTTDTPSGPGEEAFDATQTQAELESLDAAFETPAFQSLAVLGEHFNSSTGSAAAASAALLSGARPSFGTSIGDLARDASERLTEAYATASASMAPIIPADWLARTYVYDPETESYVHDPERTGAPSNGIRFILYAVNPVNHTIIVADEIGHADVTDVGSDNATALRLEVVSDGVTYLDYTITATGVFNAPVFEIAGFITDGQKQIDFTLRHAVLATIGSLEVDIDYDIQTSEDFSVTVDIVLAGDQENNTITVNLTLQHGANTVLLEGEVFNGTGEIAVSGNGEVFAVIHLAPGSVSVTDPEGNPITQETHDALERIWKVVEDVFGVFEHLFRPIEWLFDFGG